MMSKICLQLGSVPDLDVTVNMAPVDYVSKAIVYLSRQKDSLGKAFHLVNPHPVRLNDLVGGIHSCGYPLRRVSYDAWRAGLTRLAEQSQEGTLSPLLSLVRERMAGDPTRERIRVPQFDCQNTLGGLAGSSIVCPSVDADLLDTYFSYLVRSGFLEAPRRGRSAPRESSPG